VRNTVLLQESRLRDLARNPHRTLFPSAESCTSLNVQNFALFIMCKYTHIMWFSDAPGLGAQLRAQRRARGLTQDELAKLAQISRRTLISIEQGKSAELSKVFAVLRTLGLRMRIEQAPLDSFGLGSLEQETDPL
jgi:DNA-binding XRE family transcriptional regulator